MILPAIQRDPSSGRFWIEVTDEYARAFDMLDHGFPLPVDLEMKLNEQGYNVAHLYNLFDM